MWKKKLVVIDDEEPIADILHFLFQKEGFQVQCAYNGQEGIELVKELRPDIVLLDVMLPDCNGREVCDAIRKTYDMPIIRLTANSLGVDKKWCINIGADDYVIKPFHSKELIALVKATLP